MERFWSKVDVRGPGECWEWKGRRHRQGYGTFKVGGRYKLAHRVAWELTFGKLEDGVKVRHKTCDNPPCCNPAHLASGTQTDNVRDMDLHGRRSVGASHGKNVCGEKNGVSKLTEDGVKSIRSEYETGSVSQAQLAERHGVSQRLVGMVVRRELWRHV